MGDKLAIVLLSDMRMAMGKAAITVAVSDLGIISVDIAGDSRQYPALVGALGAAHHVMQRQLENEIQNDPLGNHEDTEGVKKVKKVSKNEAFQHYIKIGERIQQRLKAINDSDDRAVFHINANLPKEL